MESSPVEARLRRIGEVYEQATEAAWEEDLERLYALVKEVDELLGSLAPGEMSADEVREHDRAVEAHQGLQEAVVDAMGDVRQSMTRGRRGLKVLSAYGGRVDANGLRVEREG